MNFELHKIDDNIDSCFLYINEISDDLSEFIMNNLLEIVSGKLEAERCEPENYKEALIFPPYFGLAQAICLANSIGLKYPREECLLFLI
jgi:hypothetical protein